ncbi:MAG: Cysteine-rich secretory protein family protein [Firmicutes bacterium ADurb.Bin300]|nr:MAG: Cysteine-rich secretory protein family protein [Firmicutes bacterium ADurb.Bin300]
MKYITKKAIAIIVSLLAASGIFAGSPNSDTNQSTESQNTTVCQQTTSDYIAKETTASDGECNDCETEITTERATEERTTRYESTTAKQENKTTQPSTKPSTTKPSTTRPETTTQSNISIEEQVVILVNEERQSRGLKPLKLNAKLSEVARKKSQDMRDNNYFSHTSPVYGSPFDMMRSFGITYKTAGENIAMGYSSAQKVMQGWMNSSGHRANILNPSFTQIGVGYVADGHYWTQQFIG